MISSGTSALVRCTCSAAGRILSSANRRKVSATSSKSSERWVGPLPCLTHWSASAFEEFRRPVLRHERHRARQRVAFDAPDLAPAQHPRGDVVDRVGDVRAREHRLDLAVLAVAAHHARALDRRGRVREVVRRDLVLVEERDRDLAVVAGLLREAASAGVDDGLGDLDRRGGSAQLVRHPARLGDAAGVDSWT